MGNFSYGALKTSLAARSGKPFLRDTSVVYAGPGEAYNMSKIDNNGPG